MEDFIQLIDSFQKPNEPNYKLCFTFGYFDSQSQFFQSHIDSHVIQNILQKNLNCNYIRQNIPFLQFLPNFTKYFRITPTMWDMKIDYVLSEQQAIFLSQNSFRIIVSYQYLHKLLPVLINILMENPEYNNFSSLHTPPIFQLMNLL